MSKVKMIVQWVLVGILVMFVIAWWPSLSAVLYLLSAIILLPIKPLEEALEKMKIKFAIRLVIAFIIFVIGIVNSPEDPPRLAAKNAEQNASSSDDKDKKDDKKDSKKDDKKDSDSKKDSDDKKDSDSKKSSDSKKDNDSSDDVDISDQILDTWHYGSSRALDFFYTFYDDGTWDMTAEGGSTDDGTYEIVDGKTIKMWGRNEDHTFKIKNADKLVDEEGEALTRYVPRTYD